MDATTKNAQQTWDAEEVLAGTRCPMSGATPRPCCNGNLAAALLAAMTPAALAHRLAHDEADLFRAKKNHDDLVAFVRRIRKIHTQHNAGPGAEAAFRQAAIDARALLSRIDAEGGA